VLVLAPFVCSGLAGQLVHTPISTPVVVAASSRSAIISRDGCLALIQFRTALADDAVYQMCGRRRRVITPPGALRAFVPWIVIVEDVGRFGGFCDGFLVYSTCAFRYPDSQFSSSFIVPD